MRVSIDSARVPLSVLDLAPVGAGQTSADALQASTLLARRTEELGYRRFWVAEHHNMPGIASTSPAVLLAHLAARTATILVGSGGVMLPNHAPLVVAEQFALLEALHPGRIDLGIGRAPGTDPATAAALRRTPEGLGAEDFPRELEDLLTLLGVAGHGGAGHGERRAHRMSATPVAASAPRVWLLGSSGYSAQVAGILGLPFAFAHHFSARNTLPALDLYRSTFQPVGGPRPAVRHGDPAGGRRRHLRGGRAAGAARATGAGVAALRPATDVAEPGRGRRARVDRGRARHRRHVSGSADGGRSRRGAGRAGELVASTAADELMVTTMTYGLDARLRSFELLAKAWT